MHEQRAEGLQELVNLVAIVGPPFRRSCESHLPENEVHPLLFPQRLTNRFLVFRTLFHVRKALLSRECLNPIHPQYFPHILQRVDLLPSMQNIRAHPAMC